MKIKEVIVHVVASEDLDFLTNQVNELHVEIIRRRLSKSQLTKEQKITVVNKISEILYHELNTYKST